MRTSRSGPRSKQPKAIRVMLVDDHPLWLDTLRKVLGHGGCKVVATASSGEEAVGAAEQSRPEVVVMDVNLPGTDGITATQRLLALDPGVRVLALSSSDEPSSVLGIVRAGAAGYLVKTAGGAEVAEAVHRVHSGEMVFPPALTEYVLAELRGSQREAAAEEVLQVVLADEAVLNREGLARILAEAGMIVAGQTADAQGLDELIASRRPDVAVVDVKIAAQRVGSRRFIHALRNRFPDTAVLILSGEVESAQALKLMSRGAAGLGYLLKDHVSKVEDLVDAIRRVHGGQPVVDRDVFESLAEQPRENGTLSILTPREREVLALMAEGRSNQAICERLFLNPKSIESHVRNIFTKLGLEPAPDDHRRVLAVLTFMKQHS